MADKQAQGQAKRMDDYETTFSTEAGQRVLADLMANFHMGAVVMLLVTLMRQLFEKGSVM